MLKVTLIYSLWQYLWSHGLWFLFFAPASAESASAQINIIVKPRDSNNVLPPENTNEFSGKSHGHKGWQPDYEKNLIKTSQDKNNQVYGHVVKHDQDYSYGAVTPNSWSDENLHMRFNEVSGSSWFENYLRIEIMELKSTFEHTTGPIRKFWLEKGSPFQECHLKYQASFTFMGFM